MSYTMAVASIRLHCKLWSLHKRFLRCVCGPISVTRWHPNKRSPVILTSVTCLDIGEITSRWKKPSALSEWDVMFRPSFCWHSHLWSTYFISEIWRFVVLMNHVFFWVVKQCTFVSVHKRSKEHVHEKAYMFLRNVGNQLPENGVMTWTAAIRRFIKQLWILVLYHLQLDTYYITVNSLQTISSRIFSYIIFKQHKTWYSAICEVFIQFRYCTLLVQFSNHFKLNIFKYFPNNSMYDILSHIYFKQFQVKNSITCLRFQVGYSAIHFLNLKWDIPVTWFSNNWKSDILFHSFQTSNWIFYQL
jgi:hypothetical protein